MKELTILLEQHGISLVIVAMFLWDWITNRKTNSKSLQELASANKNTAKSLEILEQQQKEQTRILMEINNRQKTLIKFNSRGDI